MAVRYHRIGTNGFSTLWAIVIRAAIREGAITAADITDGHRTMATQRARVAAQGLYDAVRNPHGAAPPSATAPHIRLGREDHAIDVNALNGAARRLDQWVASKGERLAATVSTEAWHREIVGGEAALSRLARKVADPLAGYTADERRWIREYDELLRHRRRPLRRAALRRAMTRQRKKVWRAGERHGWDTHNRRARYASLRARTT